MLKFQVDTLEGLDDGVKALYQEKEGKFTLKVDGLPQPKDNSDLESRLKKLEANNKDLLAEKIKAKEEAEKASLEAARKGGDIEALEKSWGEKLTTAVSTKDQELKQFQEMVSQLTVGSAATSIAAEIFGEHAELMMHHVQSRLTYEVSEGKPKVRVLDDGKPSAKSLDDLKEEFRVSKKFAPFVVGSKASGGGSFQKGGTQSTKKWADMTDNERVALRKDSPAEYTRIVEEFKRGK